MSSVIHPVGPEEPKVYWVRRLVVILVGVVAVVLLAALVAAMVGDGDEPTAPATEEPAGPEDPAAAPPAGTPVACEAGQLALGLTTAARAHPAGTPVTFDVTITNTSTIPCTVDAGEASRGILVTSGADRIWSNLDCPAEGTESRELLLPAEGMDLAQAIWGRVRSDEACTANLPEPRPGTYKAVASVNGATSPEAVFDLG